MCIRDRTKATLQAKKAGKYLSRNEKLKRYGKGALAGGVAEAAFVGDVEDAATLGATLMDLGVDQNRAEAVEAYFDEINPFDEMAEATAAGKITELIVNLVFLVVLLLR